MMISGIATAADKDVIIGFKKPVGQQEDDVIHGYGGNAKENFHIIFAVSARVPENRIAEIKNDPRVAYVEDEQTYKATDEYTNSWGVQHIGSQIIHDQNITGAGIKIAVLDTGIDYTHIDLKDNYKGGYNFVYNTTNPMDDSTGILINSHGTHVAGIIAAEMNGIGVIGVAPNASLYAVKVLNGGGSGTTSWIISGIQWAIDNKMNIVSMSLSCVPDPNFPGMCVSTALYDTVNNAYNTGLLLVAAGGNYGGGPVGYPAAYDSVIAVTATDTLDQRASFSPIDPKIELAAPGVDIYSTIIGGGYAAKSGTSMAAPHVTGVAALIYSTNFPDVNGDGKRDNKDVRLILQNSSKDLGVQGRDNIYGYGLVDASMALLGIRSGGNGNGGDIKLTLIVTKPDNDSKRVNLSQGNYSVTINNTNLSEVDVNVYENGVLRKDLSHKYEFNNKLKNVSFNLNVKNTIEVVFIPDGNKWSIGNVTIKKF